MSHRSFALTAGTQGIRIDVPDAVELLPIDSPLDPAPALSDTQQQELIRAALAKPEVGLPLRQLAQGRRRVAVLVGDLSQPAPYDIILPELIQALVEAEIRPSRITFLVHPGNGGAVLGRGAIRRYGEHAVGDHEVGAWTWADGGPAAADPAFDAADLRIALRPLLAGASALPASQPVDLELRLALGRKLNLDLVAVHAFSGDTRPEWPILKDAHSASDGDVSICGGGGGEWEQTLEEALLSLSLLSNSNGAASAGPRTKTAVLAFSGEDGLGSARFVNDLWSLLGEADQVLARDGALPPASDAQAGTPHAPFDPVSVVADSITRYSNLILFSPTFMEHPEGDDFADRLLEWPRAAGRVQLCGSQGSLWAALAKLHGEAFRLKLEPLGWRQFLLP